jgi:hypothetical protein
MTQGGGPKKIGDVLGRILAKHGYADLTIRLELEQCWKRSAGERVSKYTRVGAFKSGVLEILVDHPALLGELQGFHKQSLLQSLQETVQQSKIREIKFRRS